MDETKITDIHATYNFSYDEINFFFINKTANKRNQILLNGEWKTIEPYAHVPASCTISNLVAQKLCDELWTCGIRPNEAKGSVGQLSAVENHLKDMRTIAFKKLDILNV